VHAEYNTFCATDDHRTSRRTVVPKLRYLIPLLSVLPYCPYQYRLGAALIEHRPKRLQSPRPAGPSTPATSLSDSSRSTLKPAPLTHLNLLLWHQNHHFHTDQHPSKQPPCPSRLSSQMSHTGTRNAMTSARTSRGHNRTSAPLRRV
jgi:hypothetical protein